jgi:hypothetical protein
MEDGNREWREGRVTEKGGGEQEMKKTASPKLTWIHDDKRIRAESDDIFRRYKEGEFEIDGERARKTPFKVKLEDRIQKKVWRSELLDGNLADVFALAITRYQMNRYSLTMRALAAHDLILVYRALQSNECLRVADTITMKRDYEKLKAKCEKMEKEMSSKFAQCPRCDYKIGDETSVVQSS